MRAARLYEVGSALKVEEVTEPTRKSCFKKSRFVAHLCFLNKRRVNYST